MGEILLIALGSLYIYQRVMLEPTLDGRTRLQKIKLDDKPFNCLFCLSFWVGLGISVYMKDFSYIAIPLIYRVIQVKLLR